MIPRNGSNAAVSTRYNRHMNTKEKLTQALRDAMRAKDNVSKRAVRMALAAIKNAEIAKKDDLDDAAILAILQKEVKSLNETIDGAEQAGRDDLIAEAEAEIKVLEVFLPQALSTDEIETLVKDAITESGAASPREMGKVMQLLMPKTQGRADGKVVSQIVRKLLSQ
jgi:uncharacterized protein